MGNIPTVQAYAACLEELPPAPRPDPAIRLPRATEQAHGLVTTAARRQIESDVPLGVLLSGGIDSSLVCVALASQLPDRFYPMFLGRKGNES